MDWSGITTIFSKELFFKMMDDYQKARGAIDKTEFKASFYGVLGNWMNWLFYNINRACDMRDSERRNRGTEQVKQTLSTICRLQETISNAFKG